MLNFIRKSLLQKKSELLHLIARVRTANSRKVTLHILAKAFMQQQANIY